MANSSKGSGPVVKKEEKTEPGTCDKKFPFKKGANKFVYFYYFCSTKVFIFCIALGFSSECLYNLESLEEKNQRGCIRHSFVRLCLVMLILLFNCSLMLPPL